jgi:hypothetical protein
VDKEAASFAIVEAKDFRARWLEEIALQEHDRSAALCKNVMSWLEALKSNQEDELDRLVKHCHLGSCDWIFQNPKLKTWTRQSADHAVLWLKGKPGSGTSSFPG